MHIDSTDFKNLLQKIQVNELKKQLAIGSLKSKPGSAQMIESMQRIMTE